VVKIYGKLSSEVYGIDKYIGKSYGDVEYYGERLNGVKGKVLEPAVGNGRILIPLLEKGFEIEGFDFSEDMLDLFAKQCKEKGLDSSISKLDMANFSMGRTYQAVIVPTGSFLLLHKLEDSINALNCFYEHLEENGKLILDILLPDRFEIVFVSKRVFTNQQGESITLEETLVEVDQINQYRTFHNRYEKWRDGELISSEHEIFPLKWYGVEEFRLMLEKAGFSDIVISSDYNYQDYPTHVSQIITFEAKKANL